MIPSSADHAHVRKMYLDALAREEYENARRMLRSLVILAMTMIAIGAALTVVHFWR